MKTPESITEQYVVVRRDFLAHLPHLTSQAAAILLLLLTAIDQFRRNNPNQITLENDDIRLALLLQDTYGDDRNFCRLMKRKCGELYLLQVEGIPIFQWIDIQKGCVKFCITQEAMAFFQGFRRRSKKLKRKRKPYVKIWLADVCSFRGRYTWDWFKMFLCNSSSAVKECTHLFTVRSIKASLGLDGGAYMRTEENGGFDRANFERNCIKAALKELQKCRQISIVEQDDGSYYEKRYYSVEHSPNPKLMRVSGYYMKYRVDYDIPKVSQLTKAS